MSILLPCNEVNDPVEVAQPVRGSMKVVSLQGSRVIPCITQPLPHHHHHHHPHRRHRCCCRPHPGTTTAPSLVQSQVHSRWQCSAQSSGQPHQRGRPCAGALRSQLQKGRHRTFTMDRSCLYGLSSCTISAFTYFSYVWVSKSRPCLPQAYL